MSSTTPQQIAVTIRIDPSSALAFDDVVRELLQAGLEDAAAHPRFGVVNGTASPAVVSLLRDIPGVASVREDREYGTRRDP